MMEEIMSTKSTHRASTSAQFVAGKSARKDLSPAHNERVVKPSTHTGSLSFSQAKAAVTAIMLSRGK